MNCNISQEIQKIPFILIHISCQGNGIDTITKYNSKNNYNTTVKPVKAIYICCNKNQYYQMYTTIMCKTKSKFNGIDCEKNVPNVITCLYQYRGCC